MAMLAVSACAVTRSRDVALGQAGVGHGQAGAPASGGFARCEQRLSRAGHRLLAVAGASVTAGTGPDDQRLSWAAQFAREQHWNAVIVGAPGVGYTRANAVGQGPATRLAGREDLASLRPSLVILQFGYDDNGVPAAVEQRNVAATLRDVHAQAPRARIAIITVFTPADAAREPAGAESTDHAIAAAATAVPGTIVMDPLTQHWSFQRAQPGGLHPSAAGDAQIAQRVAEELRDHGVSPAGAGGTTPLICDSGVGDGAPPAPSAWLATR
ncbi:MAG: SGNH/GDSL hydrolase family protein [Nocardiopsaceae bacterium]|nr:SGNH/GDSL hydrolase family protein [Nocardiopsaceae bacterium]